MTDALRHRGPDGSGTCIRADERVALGHRRLSIIDLSSAGHQPMANEDGTVRITYNGEIYNYARAARRARGARPPLPLATDTEAIVHLYEEEGPRCVERLRRDVRLRDLGRAPARAVPRPRPPRHQAALLRALPERPRSSARRSRRSSSTRRSPRDLDEEAFASLPDVRLHAAAADDVPGISKLGAGEWMTVRPTARRSVATWWDADAAGAVADEVAEMSEPEMVAERAPPAPRIGRASA